MKETHMFEIVHEIIHNTSLTMISLAYTTDGIQGVFEDAYDKQKVTIKITPFDETKKD